MNRVGAIIYIPLVIDNLFVQWGNAQPVCALVGAAKLCVKCTAAVEETDCAFHMLEWAHRRVYVQHSIIGFKTPLLHPVATTST